MRCGLRLLPNTDNGSSAMNRISYLTMATALGVGLYFGRHDMPTLSWPVFLVGFALGSFRAWWSGFPSSPMGYALTVCSGLLHAIAIVIAATMSDHLQFGAPPSN